jgi:hypothetical protein
MQGFVWKEGYERREMRFRKDFKANSSTSSTNVCLNRSKSYLDEENSYLESRKSFLEIPPKIKINS